MLSFADSRTEPNSYRPDIDGLRAIAVLSVLLGHLSSSLMPGGFVGVDIFFVISGYLITSQVQKEACNGTFSLKQFYKRRINRIVPALMPVLIATLAVGYFVLSPVDLVRMMKSACLTMIGLSNVLFWHEYGTYFAGKATEAPLLNTWSLGVEEQFYIIWPLLVILLLKISRKYAAIALGILTICAVIVSVVGVTFSPLASYYLLPTRFFELMAGGLLALIAVRSRLESRFASQVCFFAGISLLGGSLLWLNKSSAFPGTNAIWPCLGTVLLIWSGSIQDAAPSILTSRPLVFIGLISYSLYLWHWPVIAYLNYMNIEIGPFIGISVICGSFVLAWASWKFVEGPMRRTGASLPFSQVVSRRFLIPVAAVFSIGLVITYAKGFPSRFDPRVAEYERVLEARPDLLRRGCHVPSSQYDTAPDPDKCRLGSEKAGLDGVLIGDSYANHFTGMVDVMAKVEGVSIMDHTMDSCPPILGYSSDVRPAVAKNCRKRNDAVFAMLRTNHYSRVVMAAMWPKSGEAGKALMVSIEAVLDTGAKLTLILDNEYINNATTCPLRNLMYGTAEVCEQPRQVRPEYFNEIRTRFPSIVMIDPNQVICHRQTCSPLIGGTPLYRDDRHLNDIGSRLIGQALLSMGVKL
jgi:peptidoglycan/LPS O-acetylase OafA/YrhL